MLKFIKHALEELEHVVWPTPEESKKYMLYTIGVIIIMAAILSIVGYALRGTLVGIRSQFDHTPITSVSGSGEDLATEADLERLKNEFDKKQAAQSGAQLPEPTSATGMSDTGVIIEKLP